MMPASRFMKHTIEGYRGRLQTAARARQYAERFENRSRQRIDRRERSAVRRIFAQLPGCATVLDVPSGAGRLAHALSQGRRMVIEMDVAFEILLHARQRVERDREKAVMIQADASKLPMADDAVDAVFCNRLLHHLLVAEERKIILRELRRVSRRHVVVSFFDYQAFGSIRRVLKRLKGKKLNYMSQPTLRDFKREAQECGLRVVSVERVGLPWVSQKYCVMEKA